MEWFEMVDTIKPYVVRIETPQGSGTGFLFGYNANRKIAAVATAAHVVEHAHDWQTPIKLTHASSGKSSFVPEATRAIFLDRPRDSASILLFSTDLPFPDKALPLMDATKAKKVGVQVGWVGFPEVAYPKLCFFTGPVSAFIQRDDCYLLDGVAIPGVSGGPVFTESGGTVEIIGSVSAYISSRIGAPSGLLRAQDISPFSVTLQTIKSFDEAKKQEETKTQAESAEKKEQPAPKELPEGKEGASK